MNRTARVKTKPDLRCKFKRYLSEYRQVGNVIRVRSEPETPLKIKQTLAQEK